MDSPLVRQFSFALGWNISSLPPHQHHQKQVQLVCKFREKIKKERKKELQIEAEIRIFSSMNPEGLIGNQGNQMHGSLFRYPMNSIFTINNHMPWKVSAQRHRPQSKVSGASFDLLANCLLLLVTVFASLTVTVFASSTVTEFALNRNNTCLFEIKLFAIMLHSI